MSGNRAVVYQSPRKLTVENRETPKLEFKGKKLPHAVILKVVATNICGSDQHIYRGRFTVPAGTILGHEITGEVVEKGSDVEMLEIGDLVSVPFNVSCGRCRNCGDRHPEICAHVNPLAPVGAYGFDLGGWQGGQADYVLVPYADFNLLKFPDKDKAMAKILEVTYLSDILPTAFHGCISAGVAPGATVYIAGAGPVGRAAAASARLLGASVIIVGDPNHERRNVVRQAGFETIDPGSTTSLESQIEAIAGFPEVDCGVDCVGFEAHGLGLDSKIERPQAVLNSLIDVVRAGGGIGVPGIYVGEDPGTNDEARHGTLRVDFGKGWIKSLRITTGMAPVKNYNRQLLQAILHDRIDLLPVMNAAVVSLEEGPEAYAAFDLGASEKFVLDPQGVIAKAHPSAAKQLTAV